MTTKQAAAKRRGAKFETDVLTWLRDLKFMAERLARAGKDDEGDIVVLVAGKQYVLELKNTARLDLPQFWREATTEAANYAEARNLPAVPPAFVVVKRRNASIGDAWVIQSLDQWSEGVTAANEIR